MFWKDRMVPFRLLARPLWRCGAVTAAVMVLAPGCPMRALGATLKDVSVSAFHAEVLRLEGVVAQCASAAAACNADDVGGDVLVVGRAGGDFADGGFAEHWEWLRSAIEQAKSARGAERTTLLRQPAAQLDEMARESVAAPQAPKDVRRVRAEADAVLARAEFRQAAGPTWWERKKAQMFAWLGQLLEGIAMAGSAAPWLGMLVEWVLFVGAAVGLLFLLLRNVTRQRLRVSLGGEAREAAAWNREAEDWAAWAEQRADSGEWRDAVHCLYWAAIVLLEQRRAWRHNPARTPREYVRLLRAGSAQQKSLLGLTRILERVWYCLRDTSAEEYAEARVLYERIADGAAQGEGLNDGAGLELPTGGSV